MLRGGRLTDPASESPLAASLELANFRAVPIENDLLLSAKLVIHRLGSGGRPAMAARRRAATLRMDWAWALDEPMLSGATPFSSPSHCHCLGML